MQVQHGLSQIVSLIISYYLPIENEMMKMQVGFLLSGVFYTLVNSNHMEKIKNFIWKRNTHVIINEKINNKNNPIYDKLETYVIDKYVSNRVSSLINHLSIRSLYIPGRERKKF